MKLSKRSIVQLIISLVLILSIILPTYARQASICPCCLQSFCKCSCDEKTHVDRLPLKPKTCTKTGQFNITCADCSHFNTLGDCTLNSERNGFSKQLAYAYNQSTLSEIEFMVSAKTTVTIHDRDLLLQPPKFLLSCSLLV
jgi:hypothetical protein